ncbi:MAG: glycerol-3-phosphate dehydrogenase/oxidase [Pseudomonadota bacterium]|nr:glycerol-3-phosphate dehydrogenase/oxidase [Pseudomonadota bacterium]
MKRESAVERLSNPAEDWDFVVIGGGATGLGCAVDAAARGYRVALLEQFDFAKGTSSRSTKLVHGGVRYLRQGNISLVLEALRERGLLSGNASHLVRHQAFIIPNYSWWEGPFYGIGMKVYDTLAGKLGLSPSRVLSREETLEAIPTLDEEGLTGGVIYYDGQFDDSRLAVNLAQTVFDLGGVAVNRFRVEGLVKDSGLVRGVQARDLESDTAFELRAKGVINATGVFTDQVRHMDDASVPGVIAASQGVHLILPRTFLPGDAAIMVPHTTDGRILFAVPWHDRVILGTTDTPMVEIDIEPRPLEEEIAFILDNASQYLESPPTRDDVLSVYAGLRPLVKAGDGSSTAALSRDHTILVSDSGLVSVAGGKWTTYRKMAEDTLDHAQLVALLEHRPCVTQELKIHGCMNTPTAGTSPMDLYGSDAEGIRSICRDRPDLAEPLSAKLPYNGAEVVWAARHEMARSVEDVLARRTRALLLDARASIGIAPRVAEIVAEELGRDESWAARSTEEYIQLARGYLIRG